MVAEVLPSIIEFGANVAEAERPDPLPVGEYHASVRAAVRKRSDKGTEFGVISFMINPEAYPADYPQENAPDGVIIDYFTPGMPGESGTRPSDLFRWRQLLEALGAPMGTSLDMNALVGLDARVNVTHRLWEGEKQLKITSVKAV